MKKWTLRDRLAGVLGTGSVAEVEFEVLEVMLVDLEAELWWDADDVALLAAG